MARATTKTDLITAANTQYEKLWKLFESMTEDQQSADFHFNSSIGKEAHWTRDKNLRDVFTHLYEWHQLLLHWVEANQKGEERPFLPKPYNWKTYGQMNVEFWEKHQATSYEDSKEMFRSSHREVMELIGLFTNEELFERKHFSWTGTSTLGSYCVSNTSSHYEWAMKKMRAHIKTFK